MNENAFFILISCKLATKQLQLVCFYSVPPLGGAPSPDNMADVYLSLPAVTRQTDSYRLLDINRHPTARDSDNLYCSD